MNHRKQVEERILFILLTYQKEIVSDNSSPNSFDIIRKHSLTWEDFEEKTHQDIMKAILNQMGQLPFLDITRLVEFRPKEYKTFEQQGNIFLSMIVNLKNTSFASFSELEPLLYKLKEFVMSRFLQNVAQNILSTNLGTVDVIKYSQDIVEKQNNLYSRLTEGIVQKEEGTNEMINELHKKIERVRTTGKIGGIPIHINSIQDILYGLNEPDLIIIGARPSMGKTETGISFADNAALQGYDAMYVSIEMNKQQIMNKIVAKNTGISAKDIRLGNITNEQFAIVAEWYKHINNSPLRIMSSVYRNLEKLIAKARELHKVGKLKIIFIDYLQLMQTNQKYSNRDQMMGIITGDLKALALELNIPIVALCQLKRGAAGRRPTLEDLRESGNIEQDADVVCFIHRPAMGQSNYDDIPYEQQFMTEFLIRKNRGGELGTAAYFQDVRKSQTYDLPN